MLERLKAFFSGQVPGDKGESAAGAWQTGLSRPSPNAKPEENELVHELYGRFQAAIAGDNQAHPRYDEYLKRWRRRYRLPDRAEWRANILTGDEFAQIETQVSLTIGSIPRPEVIPKDDPKLAMLGPIWQSLLDDWTKRYNIFRRLRRADRIRYLNGEVTVKVFWNPNLAGGLGDVDMKVCDPRNLYLDHEATSWEDKGYYFEIEYFTPQELERIFGERAQGLSVGEDTIGGLGMASEASSGTHRERIRVIRCHWDDFTEEDVEIDPMTGIPVDEQEPVPIGGDRDSYSDLDEKTQEPDVDEVEPMPEPKKKPKPLVLKRLKYPSGRITVFADDMRLLFDGPNDKPFWQHVRWYNYDDPHTAVGIAEMDLTRDSQDAKDTFSSNVADHAAQFGNLRLIMETNTGIDPRQLTGAPGEVLPVNPGTAQGIRWDQPPSIQPYVLQFPEAMAAAIQKATGVQDVLQGIRPGGLETFATLNALRESGLSRVRPKVDDFDLALAEIYERVIYLMQTRYSFARRIEVAGENAERLKNIAENQIMQQQIQQNAMSAGVPEELSPDVLRFVGNVGKSFYFDVLGKGLAGAMKIRLERGNLVSMTQAEIAAQAVELYKIGGVDRRAMLEAIRFPGRESILERMEQAEQQQAMAEQQQQAEQQQAKQPGYNGAPATEPQQQTTGKLADFGMLSPDQENVILAHGQFLVPHQGEDHAAHLRSHQVALSQTPQENQGAILDHIQRTWAMKGGE